MIFKSLFGSFNKDQVSTEPQMEVQTEPELTTSDESSNSTDEPEKKDKDGMISITYGTGMPIDLIYNFIRKSYESNGYDDAFISQEPVYKEMNIKRLRGLLEIKFHQVGLKYESNLRLLEQRIETCRSNGLFETTNRLSSEKALFIYHLEKLDSLEKDYMENKPYMTAFITSYENGYLRGLATVAFGGTSLDNRTSNFNEL